VDSLRDLDQYAVTVKDRHLFVNLSKFRRGVERLEPPPQVECNNPNLALFYSCHLRETPIVP